MQLSKFERKDFSIVSHGMKFEQALALGPLEGKITFPLFASLSPC